MLIKLKNIYFDNLKSYESDILLNKKLLNNSGYVFKKNLMMF